MNVQTPEELAEQIADWLGIYGGCKSTGDEGCEYDECMPDHILPKRFCCRQGFVDLMQNKIKAAVENEQKLTAAGIINS